MFGLYTGYGDFYRTLTVSRNSATTAANTSQSRQMLRQWITVAEARRRWGHGRRCACYPAGSTFLRRWICRSVCEAGTSWPLNGWTAMSLAAVISL